ncbi:MAG: hypothetical protein IT371_20525 [Deltaproteobacteria bacterium]|nr:hypothetical protein [Deltaproteobacteria bacterium]
MFQLVTTVTHRTWARQLALFLWALTGGAGCGTTAPQGDGGLTDAAASSGWDGGDGGSAVDGARADGRATGVGDARAGGDRALGGDGGVARDAYLPALPTGVTPWVVVPRVTTAHLNDLWGASPTDLWAVGSSGTTLHYDGKSWQAVPNGLVLPGGKPMYLWSVMGRASNDIWAVGAEGALAHYDGAKWTAVPSGTTNSLSSLWIDASGEGWAAGSRETMLQLKGGAWSRVTVPKDLGDLGGLGGTSPSDVWASASRYVAIDPTTGTSVTKTLHYDGKGWQVVTDGPSVGPAEHFALPSGELVANAAYRVGLFDPVKRTTRQILQMHTLATASVRGPSATDLWGVGYGSSGPSQLGTAVVLHFDGSGWLRAIPSANARLNAVWAGSGQEVWAVGEYGLIMKLGRAPAFNAGGGACDRLSSPVPVPASPLGAPATSVWGSSDSDVWAASGETLYHFDGKTWTADPISPKEPFTSLHGTDASNVWAATANSIWRYDGKTWTSMWSKPSSIGKIGYYRQVVTLSPTDVWSGDGMVGEVLHYDGKTWSQTGVPTRRGIHDISTATPGELWVLTFNGELYRTNGTTWTAVTGLPPGRATALWVGSPSNMWLATESVLAHYDGTTWSQTPLGTESLAWTTAVKRIVASPTTGVAWAVNHWGQPLRFDPAHGWAPTRATQFMNLSTALWMSPSGALWKGAYGSLEPQVCRAVP